MKYMIFDLETQNHVYYKRLASPWDPRNWIVAYGWKIQGEEENKGIYYPEHTDVCTSDFNIPDDVTHLVGHNLKFDLLWIWKHPSLIKFIERGGKIWCTQLAEYILCSMDPKSHYNTLQDCSIKYGGTVKYDIVKELWEAGVLTADIPKDILMDYLLGSEEAGIGDIGNTEKVFLGQVAAGRESKQLHTIMSRQESLLCTTEMEYNGLVIDKEQGLALAKELQIELDEVQTALNKLIPVIPDELEFNWGSQYHVSALLFGGDIKYKKWMPHLDDSGDPIYCQMTIKEDCLDANNDPIRIKSGKRAGEIRTRNVTVDDPARPKGAQQDITFSFKRITEPNLDWAGKRELSCGTPVFSTNSDTLDHLIAHEQGGAVPSLLARRSKLDKDLGTYFIKYDAKKDKYSGLLTLVDANGIVHGQLNHTSTKTSRLSASNPNSQNFPRGDTSNLKKIFVSRFHDGDVGEVDYSQLEVIIQAALTGDVQMQQDVIDGVDFHCKRLAAKMQEAYDDVVRKCKYEKIPLYVLGRTQVKMFTFQRAYGAGANKISAANGIPLPDVHAMIEAEEQLYPGVLTYDQRMEQAIQDSAEICVELYEENGQQRRRSYRKGRFRTPTGTEYVWREWPKAANMIRRGEPSMGFSPTERKNWSVQGCGGEVVQMVLGKLFRRFVQEGWWSGNNNHDAVLTNTVHDCVWSDSKPEVTTDVMDTMMDVMQNVPQYLLEVFKWEVIVPFRCEAEYGKNMFDLEHYNYEGVCPLAA